MSDFRAFWEGSFDQLDELLHNLQMADTDTDIGERKENNSA